MSPPSSPTDLFAPFPSFCDSHAFLKHPVGLEFSDVVDPSPTDLDDLDGLRIPPLSITDFPESDDGSIAASSIARTIEFLSQGFQHDSLLPSHPIPHPLWLAAATRVLKALRDGLAGVHREATSPTVIFSDLTAEETSSLAALSTVVEALDHYLISCEINPNEWFTCLSCLTRHHVPLEEAAWESLVGDAQGSIRAAYTSYINKSIASTIQELDGWASSTLSELKDALLTSIISHSSHSIPSSDPRICTWLETTRTSLQDHARAVLLD